MDELQRKFRAEVEAEAWHCSPLGKFMRDHPAKFREVLDAANGDWDWIARALAISSLVDHNRASPTAETARETWRRVEERRKAGMGLKRKAAPRTV